MFLLTSLPLALVALSALFPAVANARAPAGFQYGTDVHLQMPYGNTKVVSPGSRYQISGGHPFQDVTQPPAFVFPEAEKNQSYVAVALDVELSQISQPSLNATGVSGGAFLSLVQPSLRVACNSTLLTSRVAPLVPFALPNSASTEGQLIMVFLYEEPVPFKVPDPLVQQFRQMATCKKARERFDPSAALVEAGLGDSVAAVYFLIDKAAVSDCTTTTTTTRVKTVTIPSEVTSLSSSTDNTLPRTRSTNTSGDSSVFEQTEVSTSDAAVGLQPTSTGNILSGPTTTSPILATGGGSADGVTTSTLTITITAFQNVHAQASSMGLPATTTTGGLVVTAAAAGRFPGPAVHTVVALTLTAVVYYLAFL